MMTLLMSPEKLPACFSGEDGPDASPAHLAAPPLLARLRARWLDARKAAATRRAAHQARSAAAW